MFFSRMAKGFLFFVAIACITARPASAYIGPGAGISAIGAVFAAIAGIIVAIFGFVWYPVRRILRKKKKSNQEKKAK